uniref:Transmembrane protein n=1 Tax=Caenorhabditis tropicalis TaxID=1561998 RepID=A0A1I7UJF3_9PELO
MSPRYPPYRMRGREKTEINDTFHQVYVPLLKISLQISTVKYLLMLIYSIRSMQEHLALPTYCNDPTAMYRCSSSSCYWLLKMVQNLPKFMISDGFFVEQCAYLLVFFFISCALFLYAVYLIRKEEGDLRIRYRAVLTLPSMFFELIICFLSYYAMITSIFEYSRTATLNPMFFSSAFVIFAFIISIFYALLIVIHFSSLYYIMVYPIVPLSIYAVSNANYSALNYGHFGERASPHYEFQSLQTVPVFNESFHLSTMNAWPTETRSMPGGRRTARSVSSYSQYRSWNNTHRSTNNLRSGTRSRGDDENDYLELI